MDTDEERPVEAGQDDRGEEVERQPGPSAEAAAALEALAPIVGEALERIVGVLRTRGRARAEQAARLARERIDAYQARRDLDRLYQKLGREVERLAEAGEIDHPGLLRGVERVKRQHARVAGEE